MTLTFGSLFAGIGGFDLGFERAGMECRWQVEIDPFCQKVLAKHWPDVERYGDVRECGRHNLSAVDVICGGFPCQDVSVAGKGAGLDGKRSGLWFEYARIIREIRPRWVVVENVPGLLSIDAGRGMGTILRDLAKSGYDAEWDVLPASAFGAPHLRYRTFILAYPNSGRLQRWNYLAPHYDGKIKKRPISSLVSSNWDKLPSPFLYGSGHGVPNRVDRLRALGNAVVPQVAEWIGQRIVSVEQEIQ